MYRISCYARLKKRFLHYKQDSIVGVAINTMVNDNGCHLAIKNERWDFSAQNISWDMFHEYFDIIMFIPGYERKGQVPVYEGKIYW